MSQGDTMNQVNIDDVYQTLDGVLVGQPVNID
jgi:hypothetical protein